MSIETLFFGEANGNRLFEADTGYQDVDLAIAVLAESGPASTSLARHRKAHPTGRPAAEIPGDRGPEYVVTTRKMVDRESPTGRRVKAQAPIDPRFNEQGVRARRWPPSIDCRTARWYILGPPAGTRVPRPLTFTSDRQI